MLTESEKWWILWFESVKTNYIIGNYIIDIKDALFLIDSARLNQSRGTVPKTFSNFIFVSSLYIEKRSICVLPSLPLFKNDFNSIQKHPPNSAMWLLVSSPPTYQFLNENLFCGLPINEIVLRSQEKCFKINVHDKGRHAQDNFQEKSADSWTKQQFRKEYRLWP